MKRLAFVLFTYFPYGGLQRDMLEIARKCDAEGYEVNIFTTTWEGPKPDAMNVFVLGKKGLTNIANVRKFAAEFSRISKIEQFDAVIGFNKIPGLDIYYAADVCFYEKAMYDHGSLYKLTPRFRHYYRFEKSVFAPSAKTKILAISPRQIESFYNYYRTPRSRITLLPPGVGKNFIRPKNWRNIRSKVRNRIGIDEDDVLILQIGSGYRTKGLSRSIRAVASLPELIRKKLKFCIIGRGKINQYRRLAKSLNIEQNLLFLGEKKGIEHFLFSADILVHPSLTECAGIVILESLAAGLPVLCTGTCGYSSYIQNSKGGVVIDEPFRQKEFNNLLREILIDGNLAEMSANALEFARQNDIYSLHEHACSMILNHTGGAR